MDVAMRHNFLRLDPWGLEKISVFLRVKKVGLGTLYCKKNGVYRAKKSQKSEFH